MCYHSDYVFVYSQEVLLELELNFDSRVKSFDSLNILNSEESSNTNNSLPDKSSIRKRKFFEDNINTQDMCYKIQRLRQELEEAAIWRITSPDETVPTANSNSNSNSALEPANKSLDSGSSFALRYTLLYHPSLDSEPQFTSFVREVTDILKRNAVDAIHVQRICSFLIGYSIRLFYFKNNLFY
jgi:hypothetical protein